MDCTIANITKITQSRLRVEVEISDPKKVQDFHLAWLINKGNNLREDSVFDHEEAQLFDMPEAEVSIGHITKCPSNFSLADGYCWNTSENQVMSVR